MKKQKKWIQFGLILIMFFTIIPLPSIQTYTEANETELWTEVSSMNHKRTSFQSEMVDGKIYVMGGHNLDDGIRYSSCEVYDPLTNTWIELSNMNQSRSNFISEVVDGKIYVMGGLISDDLRNFNIKTNSVEVYDPLSNSWTQLSNMKDERTGSKTEVIDGKIYVLGGDSDGNSAEVYDPLTNIWSEMSNMNLNVIYTSHVINGKIYVLGYDNSNAEPITTLGEYNPRTDTWTSLRALNETRGWFQSEVIDGKIYVMGGYKYLNEHSASDSLNSVEVYDPLTNTWTELSSMNFRRSSFQSQMINGKIFVMGGFDYNSGSYLNDVEMYNPVTNTWMEMPSLIFDRYISQSHTLNGSIYIIGGRDFEGSVEKIDILPHTPQNVKAQINNAQIQLTWDVVNNADEYIVKRSNSKDGPYEIIADNVVENSYVDQNVETGTTYFYIISAVNQIGEGENSNEVTVLNYVPNTISPGLIDEEELVEGTSLTFNWHPMDTQNAFQIQIDNPSNEVVFTSEWINAENSSYYLPENVLNRGNVYGWKVRIEDKFSGTSPYSDPRYIKINSLPELMITSHSDNEQVTNNSVRLAWNYSDLDNQEQLAYQVIGSQDNWESWSYNSNEIASLDKTHTTPSLGNGEWDFGIRVNDGIEWSDWVYLNNILLPSSYEPNDDFTTAFPFTYSSTYSTTISSDLDVDFYQYTASQTGLDELTLQSTIDNYYEVHIFDGNQNLVGTGASLAGKAYYFVEGGQTYYIKIFSRDGSFSEEPYSFTVNPLELNIETHYQYDDNGNLRNK
ncbi:kelch repeat-containing protein, partial [Chengkuizengella marina]